MLINTKKSLSLRIVVYVLTFCVFLFILLLSVFYISSKSKIEKATLTNAQLRTNNVVLDAERILLSVTRIVDNYKWIIENENISREEIYALTRRMVENNSDILGAAVAFEPFFFEKEGQYFAPYSYREKDSIKTIQLGNPEYDYFYMDWYQIPMVTQKTCWTDPYFDTGGGNALITTYSTPFFRTINNERKPAGVITVDLPLDWFTEIVSSVRVLETGYASVLSPSGTFITHPNKDLIMNQSIFSYAEELGNAELREIGRQIQKTESGLVPSTLKGVERRLYYKRLPSSGWTMAIIFPVSEMYQPLRSISIVLIILVVTGLLLLSLIVSRIIKKQIAPLKFFADSARIIAGGNFTSKLPEITSEDELKDLHDSFEYVQHKLSDYIENLKQTTSAKEKIESELRIAREIQMGMIPKIFPPFPNLREIDLYATLQPAKEVGGDLYDFFMIGEEHLCFAIGDVSGKGVPASLFMAVTRTLLRSVAPDQKSPAAIVNSLNRSLSTNNDSNMFVTFFLGIVELKTGKMTYANAGHNPPVLIGPSGEAEFFEFAKNIPVGVFEEFNYEERERHLQKGDKIFLYTDGVTEAENSQDELYSENRLLKCLQENSHLDPRSMICKVTEDVASHVKGNPQSDDMTMLSIVHFGIHG
ncbi:MAG: SpoIIE family protein phosphatase [Prolixibacteraceae bacterium]